VVQYSHWATCSAFNEEILMEDFKPVPKEYQKVKRALAKAALWFLPNALNLDAYCKTHNDFIGQPENDDVAGPEGSCGFLKRSTSSQLGGKTGNRYTIPDPRFTAIFKAADKSIEYEAIQKEFDREVGYLVDAEGNKWIRKDANTVMCFLTCEDVEFSEEAVMRHILKQWRNEKKIPKAIKAKLAHIDAQLKGAPKTTRGASGGGMAAKLQAKRDAAIAAKIAAHQKRNKKGKSKRI